MNMPDFDPEYDFQPMSAISRYYNDIYNLADSYWYATNSLENLIEDMPVDVDSLMATMLRSDYMATDWEIEHDPRIAKEKLSMLPIRTLGAELEGSNCDVDMLTRWYDDALAGLRMVTEGDHLVSDCLKHSASWNTMCAHSTICPQRFMERFLTQDLLLPDFNKTMYQYEPDRGYRITSSKLSLGVSHGVVPPVYSDHLLNIYQLQYEEYIRSRTFRTSDYTL
jgi:hypothetical protein